MSKECHQSVCTEGVVTYMAQHGMLSVKEAEERVLKAVDELEEVINRANGTPRKRDKIRRADLTSHLMSLLAECYGIAPPTE